MPGRAVIGIAGIEVASKQAGIALHIGPALHMRCCGAVVWTQAQPQATIPARSSHNFKSMETYIRPMGPALLQLGYG